MPEYPSEPPHCSATVSSRGRHRLAHDPVRLGQHLAHEADRGLDGAAGAAHRLDVHVADAAGEPLLLDQAADLVDLAAQAQHDDMAEIDVPRVARERAAQHPQRLAFGHAAAAFVRERHHAIDVGKIGERVGAGERVALERVGDQPRDMGAAIHAGQDADVVARRRPPVGAADALEARRLVGHRRRVRIAAERVVARERPHAEIMHMDVLAGRDRRGREADDLAVAAHRLARLVRPHRNLVPGRDAGAGHDAGCHLAPPAAASCARSPRRHPRPVGS